MTDTSEHFLKNDLQILLQKLTANQNAVWGKMDGQQMVEHLREVFKVANGKIILPLYNTDPPKLAAARAFLFSDAPFQENIRLPVIPKEPRTHKYPDLATAITKTIDELNDFFLAYEANAAANFIHPVFGPLNYEEQLHYLMKHVKHHLKQFGLVE